MHLQWNIWTIRKEGEIMGDAIISVEELSNSFGQHEVLRKIDFNVEPGEIIRKIHAAPLHQQTGNPDQRKDPIPRKRDRGSTEGDQ